jgi:hypothetical protein
MQSEVPRGASVELPSVPEIVPDYVESGAEGRQRIDEGHGDPNGEHGILLAQSLPRLYAPRLPAD